MIGQRLRLDGVGDVRINRHPFHETGAVGIARVITEGFLAHVQIGVRVRLSRRYRIGGEAHAVFRVADFLEPADFAAVVLDVVLGKVLHRLAKDEGLLHRLPGFQFRIAADFQQAGRGGVLRAAHRKHGARLLLQRDAFQIIKRPGGNIHTGVAVACRSCGEGRGVFGVAHLLETANRTVRYLQVAFIKARHRFAQLESELGLRAFR